MVQVIPVSPKNWVVPKIQLKEGVTKSKFVFPEPRLEGENLSINITYFACVTVSTVKENVKDTEKDINNNYYYFSSVTPSGMER